MIEPKARRMTTQAGQRRHLARGHEPFSELYFEAIEAYDQDA
jgi:hypothetical protein